MKSVNKIFLAAAVALLTVGCYNDFDTPKIKVWQEDEVAGMGLTHISNLAVKKELVTRFGSLSGTGQNTSWDDTKALKLGEAYAGEDEFESAGTAFWPEAANYYIKGKVISSDEQGRLLQQVYQRQGYQQRPPGQHLQVALHLRRYGRHRAQAQRHALHDLQAQPRYEGEHLGLCPAARPLPGQLPHDALAGRRSVGLLQRRAGA